MTAMALTSTQFAELGGRLLGTRHDVTTAADILFGHEWTDDDADALHGGQGIFKCEECQLWLGVDQLEPDTFWYCKACSAAQRDYWDMEDDDELSPGSKD